MAENVENLVLEQLRLMREEMSANFETMRDRLETIEAKVDGTAAILVGLGKYIPDIDTRVEHIEEQLGVDQ